MIRSIVRDYVDFIKRPNDFQINIDNYKKAVYILFFIGVNLIIAYSVILPILERINVTESLITEVYDNASITKTFLILVLFTPFFEEFIFRYFLRYKTFMPAFLTLEKWNKIFPLLVYTFNICFAFIHLTNFSNDSLLFYILSPVIVLSQAITGFSITFIRVRLNFICGVLYHWIWNFLVIIFIPLLENYIA